MELTRDERSERVPIPVENSGSGARVPDTFCIVLDDLEGLGDPACARCLLPLQLAGTDDRPFWRCPDCGYVSLGR